MNLIRPASLILAHLQIASPAAALALVRPVARMANLILPVTGVQVPALPDRGFSNRFSSRFKKRTP